MKKMAVLFVLGLVLLWPISNVAIKVINTSKEGLKIDKNVDTNNIPPDFDEYALCGYVIDEETGSTAYLYSKEYNSECGNLYFQWNGHYDIDYILPTYWGVYTSIKGTTYTTQPPKDLSYEDEQPTGEQQGGVELNYRPGNSNNEWVVHINCVQVEMQVNKKETLHVYFEFNAGVQQVSQLVVTLDLFQITEGGLPIQFSTQFIIDINAKYVEEYWAEVDRTVVIRNYKVLSARYVNVLGNIVAQIQFRGPKSGKDTFDIFEVRPYDAGEYTLKARLYRFSSPFNYEKNEQGSKIVIKCDYDGYDPNSSYDEKSEIYEIRTYNYPGGELIKLDRSSIEIPIPPISELISNGYIESDNGLAVWDFDIIITYDYEIPIEALFNPFFYLNGMKTIQYIEADTVIYGSRGWSSPFRDTIKIDNIPVRFDIIPTL
jgi:hypothetical protein